MANNSYDGKCIGCNHWQPHLERPWVPATIRDVGSCIKQAVRQRNSSSWKVTAGRDACSCDKFASISNPTVEAV